MSSAIRSICATPSSAAAVCSICALLRKPKIPILVMTIRIAIAGTKYSLIQKVAEFQYIFSQTAPVIFANSSVLPIIITGSTLAAKIAVSPTML